MRGQDTGARPFRQQHYRLVRLLPAGLMQPAAATFEGQLLYDYPPSCISVSPTMPVGRRHARLRAVARPADRPTPRPTPAAVAQIRPSARQRARLTFLHLPCSFTHLPPLPLTSRCSPGAPSRATSCSSTALPKSPNRHRSGPRTPAPSAALLPPAPARAPCPFPNPPAPTPRPPPLPASPPAASPPVPAAAAVPGYLGMTGGSLPGR